MSISAFPSQVSILCALSLALGSCSGPGNWLIGKWEFDRQATEAALKSDPAADPAATRSFLDSLASKVGGAVSSAVAAHLEGMKMEFTLTEMRRIEKDGSGSAVGYKVIEKPDANTILIQDAKGEIMTFKREGNLMWRTLDRDGKVRIYLKRA
ncbi:MAG: hypothetical protein KGS60_12895 [Verrucomicrobia bacterium]|nr:hypothetical protein [Verrucomicrobiota bacterium]